MPISVKCACGAGFKVKDELAGRTGKCPKCGQMIRVPAPAPPPVPPEDVPVLQEAPGAPPCPSCGTLYPADVLVCTRCGVELATGQFVGLAPEAPAAAGRPGARPSRRAPLRSSGTQAAEDKSVLTALGQVFYNPAEAFDALGIYVLKSPANVGLVIGLFFLGTFLSGLHATKAEREAEKAEARRLEAMGVDERNLDYQPVTRSKEFKGEGYRMVVVRAFADTRGEAMYQILLYPDEPDREGDDWAIEVRMGGSGPWEPAGWDDPPGRGMYAFAGGFYEVPALLAREETTIEFKVFHSRVEDGQPKVIGETTHSIAFAFEKTREEQKDEVVEAMGTGVLLMIQVVVLIVALAIKAGLIDVVALFTTGASRLLAIGVVLFFLEGVVGLVRGGLWLATVVGVLPWGVATGINVVVFVWWIVLYIIAIAKTYDIPGIFAAALAIAVGLVQFFLIAGFFLAMLSRLAS